MSVFLAMMLAAATPATPPPLSTAEIKAIQTMHVVGRCLANQHADMARKVLALDFRSKGYANALRQFGRLGGICARDELGRATLRAAGMPFAGSIAEGMLEREGILADFGIRTGYRPELPGIEARNAGEFMAFCAIRKKPGETSALLRTEPASTEEAAAFAVLNSTLSGCVPAKSELEFSYDSLRALLALGAYRLALHNGQATRVAGEAAK